jgi:predicted  nucleic acid-binding Zn-ribbon protein
LGEIAQVQDRCMVEKRRMADIIAAAGRKATDEEQRTMDRLQGEITAIDGEVAQLMAEDESAQASIVQLRNDIVAREHSLQQLKIKIEEAIAQSKLSAGIASLQVTGQLFPRTHIKSPNDAMVVSELTERVLIKEQKNTDPGLGKSYVLKVSNR